MQISFEKIEPMLDITAPDRGVEVVISSTVLWINVDGICRLRICRIKPDTLTVEDARKEN